MAVSCSELYFAHCCALKSPSGNKVMRLYFIDFKKWCFDVSFLTSICVTSTNCWIFNTYWCHKHFVYWVCKLETTQDQFCVWFRRSLTRLPTETALTSIFLRKKRVFFIFSCFLYLFNDSTRLFWTISSHIHTKYYLNSQNFLPF